MIWLIDGRSGAGKTRLAGILGAELGAHVVHLDDCYPGWDGLAAGADYALHRILEPLAAGRAARWQRWDWAANRRAEWHTLDAGTSLVVEGCGSVTPATRALADHAIWIECDEATRRARALARDGEDSWWDGWRRQEDRHIAAHDPARLADEVRTC